MLCGDNKLVKEECLIKIAYSLSNFFLKYSITEGSSSPSMSLNSNSIALVLKRISMSDKKIEIEKEIKLMAKINLATVWYSINIKNMHKIESSKVATP